MTKSQTEGKKSFGIDYISKFVFADGQIWFTFQNKQLAINEDGQIQTVEYLSEAFNDFKENIYEI